MLYELGYAQSGVLRRETQGKAAFPKQARSYGLPDAGLAEYQVVVKVDQHRFRLVPIKHHYGLFASCA